MSKKISITLSENEALVLFDWLSKFNDNEKYEFEDQSQERVLWDLEAKLEIKLPVFERNYPLMVENAKQDVRDSS
jgi:hypothetical protein